MEDFYFDCNGKPTRLNGKLIELKGINLETCLVIAGLHRIKDTLKAEMQKCDKDDKPRLHILASKIRDVEFWLQDAWGFPRDENWHESWKVPHCACLSDKNEAYFPYRKFTSPYCPVHGDL